MNAVGVGGHRHFLFFRSRREVPRGGVYISFSRGSGFHYRRVSRNGLGTAGSGRSGGHQTSLRLIAACEGPFFRRERETALGDRLIGDGLSFWGNRQKTTPM